LNRRRINSNNKTFKNDRIKLRRKRNSNAPVRINKSLSIFRVLLSIIVVVFLVFGSFYYLRIKPVENQNINQFKKELTFKNKGLDVNVEPANEDIKVQKISPVIVAEIENIDVLESEKEEFKIAEQILNNQHIVVDNKINVAEKIKSTDIENVIKDKITKDSGNVKPTRIISVKTTERDIHKLYEEPVENNMIVVDHKDEASIEDSIEKVAIKEKHAKYRISIVIDDMGINRRRTKDIAGIKANITSSYLSYAKDIPNQVRMAQDSGHQIIIHVPMQPKGHKINAGSNVLLDGMTKKEISDILNKSIDKFPMADGINNHMGSKLTEVSYAMDEVMSVLSKRGLFFLDSKTTSNSVCKELAEKHNVKYLYRNVFIDNVDNKKYVLKQLKKTEDIAINNGYAIAIGHPKRGTVKALKEWLPGLKDKNIEIIHLSDLI